ncbi:NAD-dependent epimerase/dehydratase family protein [Timonella sp. A28]|uniref:NAD-dependent epimerase/dehydratase family protein n=1 Tax=Timonella sp. A28 TaxID=3442640 RepID=UPI003EC05782
MSETVLLTGGAGFIGSHLAEEYLSRGYEVVVIDDLSTGRKSNLTGILDHPKFEFYDWSILDENALERIFAAHKPTLVNHHAAQKSVPQSVHDPFTDNKLNVVGLLNLLKLAGQYGVRRFIAASSGGALAKEITHDGDLSVETDPPLLVSPYAITKFSGEKYCEIYAQLHGFDYVGLRYANVFGPRQVAEGDCGVIPIFVNNMQAGKDSTLMTYDDMPRGCTRDYIYVGDAVEFNMLASTWDSPISGVFNLSLEREFPIADVFDALEDAFASGTQLHRTGPRDGDVRRSVLSSEKAFSTFSWKAHTSLESGITILRDWYLAQK